MFHFLGHKDSFCQQSLLQEEAYCIPEESPPKKPHFDSAMTHSQHFATICVHVGSEPDKLTGAVVPPISLATTFAQNGLGSLHGVDYTNSHGRGFEYSRTGVEQSYALGYDLRSIPYHLLVSIYPMIIPDIRKPHQRGFRAGDSCCGACRVWDRIRQWTGTKFLPIQSELTINRTVYSRRNSPSNHKLFYLAKTRYYLLFRLPQQPSYRRWARTIMCCASMTFTEARKGTTLTLLKYAGTGTI